MSTQTYNWEVRIAKKAIYLQKKKKKIYGQLRQGKRGSGASIKFSVQRQKILLLQKNPNSHTPSPAHPHPKMSVPTVLTQPPPPQPPPRAHLLSALSACTSMAHLHQLHSQLVRLGLHLDNDAAGRLIKFSALSGDSHYALKLFSSLPTPDPFIYNTLIRSHSARVYLLMLARGTWPNRFTFPCLLARIADSGGDDVWFGLQVHAHAVKFGFGDDGHVQNNLINMYLGFGEEVNARKVFGGMTRTDVVTWTTMITGYARMGLVEDARELFEEMPERSSVSWNAMIAGYVQAGRFRDAFKLFGRMREDGIELDKFVAASMLSACIGLGAFEQGQWIHRYIEKSRIEPDPKLATTIIDMYCKCGCLEKAYGAFNNLRNKGQSSWNCMIGGLAIHGRGEAAIELFKEMERSKVTPDDITLLNVLSACAHSGLVHEGKHYFDYMVHTYGIEPKMEHFGCLVDLLGRAGLFEEAMNVLDEMPMDADAGVLGALLGACKIHGNVDLGEQIGSRVIELDPNNSGRYILLANLYASAGRWDDVADIRRLMNDRGVKKEPGWSIVELDGAVNEFIAGGRSHPETKEIYAKVEEMLDRIRLEGYVPDTGGVLHDIDEEEKENPLYYHSEKLAIAFGLLKTKPGETIRISKNLRVCKDCHEASKLVSRIYDREIVVRDRNRFHHFREGECSCKNYW